MFLICYLFYKKEILFLQKTITFFTQIIGKLIGRLFRQFIFDYKHNILLNILINICPKLIKIIIFSIY